MTALDSYHLRTQTSPRTRESRAWLRWICGVAVGTVTFIAFLAVAFAALYLRARLGMPSL